MTAIQDLDVKRMYLGPDDALVITIPKGAHSPGMINGIRHDLKAVFPDNKIIVVTDDMQLGVIERRW